LARLDGSVTSIFLKEPFGARRKLIPLPNEEGICEDFFTVQHLALVLIGPVVAHGTLRWRHEGKVLAAVE